MGLASAQAGRVDSPFSNAELATHFPRLGGSKVLLFEAPKSETDRLCSRTGPRIHPHSRNCRLSESLENGG